MAGLRFSLFGKFSVSCNQQLLTCFNVNKVQELICFLLLHRNKNHNREVLVESVWNDNDKPHTKKYLRKTLWQLQSALRSVPCQASDSVLQVDQQWIQVNNDAGYWLDIDIFERAFNAIKGKGGREFDSEDYQKVNNAVQLYQGDLLEGWYQDWCVFERVRLREMYLGMNEKLIGFCEVNNKIENGIEFGRKILAIDRARERTHQRLMKLYYTIGNRSAAIRQFEYCSQALEEELGVKPSERTNLIFDQIANDELPVEPKFNKGILDDPSQSLSLNRRLGRVKKLLRIQTKIQEELKEEIRDIEKILQKG